jgi:alpha,alpha-trehalase
MAHPAGELVRQDRSALRPRRRVVNSGVERYRQLNGKHLAPLETRQIGPNAVLLVTETNQSRLRVALAARTRVSVPADRALQQEPDHIAHTLGFEARQGEEVTVEKTVALFTSRDHAISEPALAASQAVAAADDFEPLLERHALAWSHLWRRCDLVLEGRHRTQVALRLHIFHLLQTVSINTVDLDVGVPARGLHGEAYRGHIFWDELFIFPFLNFRLPEVTRALLRYRYRRLPAARTLAREAGFAGAMYPWQSGSDGREESQVVHLNPRSGRWLPDHTYLQRHVNAGIAYNICRYHEATGDGEFQSFYGAEMLVEIARFWASIASSMPSASATRSAASSARTSSTSSIPGPTNPASTTTPTPTSWPPGCCTARSKPSTRSTRNAARSCARRLPSATTRLEAWDTISRRMFVPFHDGVISQFEHYEKLEEFDWGGYEEKYGDIHRLDRILEAEGDTVNRYKASKQADALMLFYLFSSEELTEQFERLGYPFDPATIPDMVDYYAKRTSHGSTLSRVVTSWVLARADRARSWELLYEALESDIGDIQGGTTKEGIHLGAMAGTVDLVQRGQTGLQIRHDMLHLDPCLPDELQGLRLRIRYRGHWLELDVDAERMRVSTPDGWTGPTKLVVHDTVHEFRSGIVL